MSNSGLAVYKNISPNRTVGRNHKIDTISIHCMAGNLTIESCGQLFASSSRQASSNYGIGSDGRIGLYVEEKDRSWCTSSPENDHRAVTIEVANTSASEPFPVSDAAMRALIKLCADICFRNNIAKLMWHGDKSLIGQVSKQNMTVHRWFAQKSCPGNYLYEKHGYIAEQVNRLLSVPYNKNDYTITGNVSAGLSDEYSGYGYIDPQSLIQVNEIHPYIVRPDSSVAKLDMTKLKNNDVVAGMAYAGCYFDTLHNVRSKYESTNLKSQIKYFDSVEMPYALWCHMRGRNNTEIKDELSELYYVISKYPPKLGIWVKIETGKTKSLNDIFLKKYKEEFIKWGLKDKFGIFATKSDMTKFTWKTFQDSFYLWMVDHTSTSEYANTLLTPEFFTYNG